MNHWVLISGQPTDKKILVHDSLNWYKHSESDPFSKKVKEQIRMVETKTKWKRKEIISSLNQSGGIDCGYFVMAFMRKDLNFWCPDDLQEDDVMRKLVLKEFVAGKIFRDCPFILAESCIVI